MTYRLWVVVARGESRWNRVALGGNHNSGVSDTLAARTTTTRRTQRRICTHHQKRPFTRTSSRLDALASGMTRAAMPKATSAVLRCQLGGLCRHQPPAGDHTYRG